jgi:integrase
LDLSLNFSWPLDITGYQPVSYRVLGIDISHDRLDKTPANKQEFAKMPRKAKELGPLDVKRLTKPGFYFVGGVAGLALQVLPTGSRSWVLRVMVGGKRRNMGLGGFPDVTLAGAREAAREARAKVVAGVNPIAERRKARLALMAELGKSVTFKAAATAFIAAREGQWRNDKHRYQWQATVETYAYPHIGNKPVHELTLRDMLNVLEPIWRTKTETAKRLRGRMEQIIDSAIVQGQRDRGDNPATWRGNLDKVLPSPDKIATVEHYPALPWKRVPAFIEALQGVEGLASEALEFLILTVVRSKPVRFALWSEIDLDKAMWAIPADHMKGNREHRVPLSPQAVELLKRLPRMSNVPAHRDYVFPGARGKMLSDMAMSMIIRRFNGKGGNWVDDAGETVVPHGFRSSFRDWVSDVTDHPGEVAEMALAHVVADKTEAAYRRGDLLERRVKLMRDWSDYCYRKPD